MKNKFYVVEFPEYSDGSLIVCANCETIASAKNHMKTLVKQEPFRTFAIIEVKELSVNAKSNIEDKIKKIDREIQQLEFQKSNLLKEAENI